MIRILDRYLLRAFFANYLLSLFVLISLYVVLDLFVNIDEFTEGGKSVLTVIRDAADYYFYNLPLFFSQLSGVITLFAACGTLARMHRQNEITAVLASGTSMYRLAMPIIIAGLMMNVLLWVDQETVLPGIAPKLARRRDDVEGLQVYEIMCVREGEDRLISALQFSPKEKRIRKLIVLESPAVAGGLSPAVSVVEADKAEWDPQNRGWRLTKGTRISEAAQGGSDTGLVRDPLEFYPSQLTPDDLLLRKRAQWIRFLSVAQLNRLAEEGDADPVQISQVKHSRYTTPVFNVILLLLGISFFMHRMPNSVLTQAAKAVGLCAIAFLVFFVGQQLVGSPDLPASLAPAPAWVPLLLFGPLAAVLLDGVKT